MTIKTAGMYSRFIQFVRCFSHLEIVKIFHSNVDIEVVILSGYIEMIAVSCEMEWRHNCDFVTYSVSFYFPVCQCCKMDIWTCQLSMTVRTAMYNWLFHSMKSALCKLSSTLVTRFPQLSQFLSACLKTILITDWYCFAWSVCIFLQFPKDPHCTQYFHNMQIAIEALESTGGNRSTVDNVGIRWVLIILHALYHWWRRSDGREVSV